MEPIRKCLIIISLCITFFLLEVLCKDSIVSKNASLWISGISCAIAFANALLVYETLLTHKQEKFETTLFNLLEGHRNLMPTIAIETDSIDRFLNKTKKEITDSELFKFSHIEILWIKQVFHSFNYPHISDDDYMQQQDYIESTRIEADEESNKETDESIKKIFHQYELSRRCDIYNISKDDWGKTYNGEEHLNEIAYTLFITKWKHNYAPYFRSLVLMFNHIANSSFDLEDKVRYRNIIIHQMSDFELEFIERHYIYYSFSSKDDRFREVLDAISNNHSFIKDRSRLRDETSTTL